MATPQIEMVHWFVPSRPYSNLGEVEPLAANTPFEVCLEFGDYEEGERPNTPEPTNGKLRFVERRTRVEKGDEEGIRQFERRCISYVYEAVADGGGVFTIAAFKVLAAHAGGGQRPPGDQMVTQLRLPVSSPTRSTEALAKADCKRLLDAATPEMFRANAFRITGLPVDATMREITKHADKLKMMEELGHGESVHTGAFALTPPPSVDRIRDAIQTLRDPESRIVDEFFWFWPDKFGNSAHDPAIQALAGGDRETALEIWTLKETSPTAGVTAMHNVAILWQLVALEWEEYAGKEQIDDARKSKIEGYWRNSFKRWELLAVDDIFWESVSARVKQLDDPRLTTGFVRRMRATLPQALDKINAELALRYAENGRMDMAQVHVQFMRETNSGLDDVEKIAELVLAPAATRLKQQIQRAKEHAAKNPTDAVKTVRELLDHARRALPLFELFFGKESEARNELSDEVAVLCNQLPIDYHKATGDDKGCIELLKAVLPFATSIDLRRQIEKNIATLTGNLTFKKLEPVYALLKVLQDSNTAPSVRFNRFKSEAVPAISKASSAISGSEEHSDLVNAAAIVLRTISLSAWNDHQDITTAVAANEMATKYACDAEIRQRLTADQATLREMAAQRAGNQAGQQKSSSGTGCPVVLGIIGFFVLIGSFGSKKSSSSSSSTSSVSTPRYAAPASTYTAPASTYSSPSTLTAQPTYTAASLNATSGKDTYRVPSYVSSELDKDKRVIESEKTKAAALENRLGIAKQTVESEKAKAEELDGQFESLKAQVDRARIYLDQTSQAAVDDFNRKVNRSNAMLGNMRTQSASVNHAVDTHNALLEQVRSQNRVVNQMVDDYNAKLRRSGR